MLEDVSYLLEDGRVRRAAQELGGTGVSHGIAEFVLGQMNAKERNGRNPRLLPLGGSLRSECPLVTQSLFVVALCVSGECATSQIAADDCVQAQRTCPRCHEEAQQDDVNKFRQGGFIAM